MGRKILSKRLNCDLPFEKIKNKKEEEKQEEKENCPLNSMICNQKHLVRIFGSKRMYFSKYIGFTHVFHSRL